MRLTKTMREAFVRAAMHDVPQINYSVPVIANVVAEFTKAGWPKK